MPNITVNFSKSYRDKKPILKAENIQELKEILTQEKIKFNNHSTDIVEIAMSSMQEWAKKYEDMIGEMIIEIILEKNETLVQTEVWYSIQNGGDGSAYPKWFLTQRDTEQDQSQMNEGWGETCNGSVQTFVGSDIYVEAINANNGLD